QNLQALSGNSNETARAVSDMVSASRRIEKSIAETADLSSRVRESAGNGSEAVGQTAAGISRIEGASGALQSVLTRLTERLVQIDDIVDVISNVTEKTNLLALNASIIAAHAGEHGTGFAVVANEIKELATQTRSSAKEISAVISTIQTESEEALTALREVTETVQSGRELAATSERALKDIVGSALASAQHAKAIARAIESQVTQGESVMKAVESIADGVRQIATATTEQSEGGESIIRLSENMRDTVERVREMIRSHAGSALGTRREFDETLSMTESIHASTREHSEASKEILRAMQTVREVAEVNLQQAEGMAQAVEAMASRASQLAEEMKRFRL
ncbi:MAG: methyl-accepting chemotaxis protein, partial [Vicinamibacteria bacterium]